MKVKVRCHKCNKEFKAYSDSIKDARALKRICKKSKFTCWDCIGVRDGVYGIGIIS